MKLAKEVAFAAARKAGQLSLERLGDVRKIDYKGVANIVTDVDQACEKIIIQMIREEFPDDEILAEESGKSSGKQSDRRWLIDPLDGTTNYAHGYPFFAVSIALTENDKGVLGVVFNAVAKELFWAELGQGAWLNDKPISVSKTGRLAESLLATGFPPNTPEAQRLSMEQFRSVTAASHGVRRDGSAALDLCFVACGRLDGFWERKLAPWDMGAGALIVEEAGGIVTDLTNGTWDIAQGNIIATNSMIQNELVAALNEKELARTIALAGS
ncbi:MAG: inositol monophosphatase [Candidatus Melainabacteria bacterium]|nr:MAG: inositol monophosphatase [Candidatus Melainabacteria bacterium]